MLKDRSGYLTRQIQNYRIFETKYYKEKKINLLELTLPPPRGSSSEPLTSAIRKLMYRQISFNCTDTYKIQPIRTSD